MTPRSLTPKAGMTPVRPYRTWMMRPLQNRRAVMRCHFPSLEEFQTELSVVEGYLLRGTYPDGFSKADKANLRRKCRNNFKIEDGVLHYRKNGGSEKEEDHWCICVRSEEEKGRILQSCHSGVAGMISCQMYIRCSYIMIVHVMQSILFVFHLY